ncbi:bacterial Ig-like domain-containing protein [Pediococcus acidilactici]|nr:bacterial Ig-like domain-containing protein [Pediococcus acidilactici]
MNEGTTENKSTATTTPNSNAAKTTDNEQAGQSYVNDNRNKTNNDDNPMVSTTDRSTTENHKENPSTKENESSTSKAVDSSNVENDLTTSDGKEKSSTKNDDAKNVKQSSDVTKTKTRVKSQTPSGQFGTSTWYIDENGVLHFSAGTFADTQSVTSFNQNPWFNYQRLIKSIVFDGKVVAGSNCRALFNELTKLQTVENAQNFDVSKVENMNYMFEGDSALEKIDVHNWDTSRVTNMSAMFKGCTELVTLDVSNWDTSQVTDLSSMFAMLSGDGKVSKLKNLDVSNWNTSKVTSMKGVFYRCASLQSLNLVGWNTANVTDMSTLFYGCSGLQELNTSGWNTSKVTNMERMFYLVGVERLDISSFDMTKVRNSTKMLNEMSNLRVIIIGSKNRLIDADLSEPNFPGTRNKWVAVNGGTEKDPHGNTLYTSHNLDFKGPSSPDTYVISEQVIIDGHDSTIIAGPNSKWSPADNFDEASDGTGAPVDLKDITVTGTVDPQTPGDYDITYSYTDAYGRHGSKTITVHVVKSEASINGHDSTLIAGPNSKWTAADNFDEATDAEGNPVDLKNVTVQGKVDPHTPGDYEVTYSYTDVSGNIVSKTITAHVIASQASVDGHDSTLIAGPNSKWNSADNFDGAKDAEGDPVDLKDVTVKGNVNSQVPGDYEVTYSYTDAYGNTVNKTITVHVIASQVNIDGHDSTLIAGPNSKWTAADNFDGATDAEGNPVDLKDVTVKGNVNPQAPGDYEVTYSYTDAYGNTVSKTITVHVKASQVNVNGHDSTLIAGPNSKWTAADNFDGATDAEGNPVDLKDVTVKGNVNPQVPGDYEVTYSYTDAYGNTVSKTITVHVKASQANVDGHDSTVIAGPNSKWTAADNFDGAKDAEGNPVDLKDVTVKGSVNPQVPGDYEVTYSYTDAYGNTVSKTITVHVIKSEASINGHDSTLIAGPNSKWTAADNFDGAKDAEGNPVDIKDVTVKGNVDPQTPGDYEVTYSYTDAYGNVASKTVIVHVNESQASIDAHDSTIIAGPNSKWNPADNFDGATNEFKGGASLSDVVVKGTVNPQVPGDYEITYSYTDACGNEVSKMVTVHVIASQVSVDGHDSTVIAGPDSKWNAADNFDGATDAEGNPVDLKDVTVKGSVDPQTPGDYEITYSYTDAYGNTVSKTVTVHVITSQASVDGHDSTLIAGPDSKWNPADNFDGATDAESNPVDLKDVTVKGNVNPQVPGDYEVTYSYTDAYGNTVSKTITVHVIASQVNVDGHDSTLIAGPNSKWDPADNFDGATDAEGNSVDLKDVTVKGSVNSQVPGDYEITYSYTDAYGNVVSKTITVHVIASQVNIDGHDSTLIAGPDSKWNPADNFDGATDAEGNPVDLKDVTVKGSVNPQVPGDYEVTYSYTDMYGNTVSKTITVHVNASQASVDSHDSTLIAGPDSKWNPADNFNGATDAAGNSVDLKDVTVKGNVDPQTPGDYEVTYSYTDMYGNTVSKTITVHVNASQVNVDGHDSTVIAGPDSKWNPTDNFDGATDAEGNPVDLKDVTVKGNVNPQVPGNYEVTYSYTDAYGNTVSKTITVHVVKSEASINGHDSTLIAGPNSKWTASDNFDGATDAEGNPVDLKDVTVKGSVNPQVPGDYEVTYSYTDAYGNTINKTITIHVIASQVNVGGHDSTLIAGPDSKWNPADNFDGATDAEGNPVDLKDVTVKGSVNPQVPGDYEVTYSYTDVYGNTVSKTITVHVIASQVNVDGHDSTVIAGPDSKWNPADNFDGATDAEGNPVDLKDVTVKGSVNPQVPGDYEVTYSYTDAYGNTVNKTITVHVNASQASVDGHDSTLIAGPNSKWTAADNFDGARDAEGNPVDLKDVTVKGSVNPQVPGDYEVTYSYTDAYGNTVSKTVTVHVKASQASVDGHDSTLIAGPDSKWNPADNFDGATDTEGNPVDLKDVTVKGSVNPQVPGDYEVTYSYTDAYGNTVSKTVTVHVNASQASVDDHDSTLIAGPDSKWNPADNFDGATDAEGNPIDLKDVTVKGNVDPQTPGDYEVTYSYTDAYGNTVNKTITVHVTASQETVDGHDITVVAGPNSTWDPAEDFDGATDAAGHSVDLKDVTVKGNVDPQTPGDYEVTYSYTDAYGNTVSKTVTVHVTASQETVDGHDTTIIAGPNSTWNPLEDFDGAKDAEGNPISLKDVTVKGNVDPHTPGDYEVTYSYTDAYGNQVDKTVVVHVVDSQASVAAHDSTIVGDANASWKAEDNFDGATDANGNLVDFSEVTVEGKVNPNVAGDYVVTYTYTDAYGNVVSKQVVVHVIAGKGSDNDQPTPDTPKSNDDPEDNTSSDSSSNASNDTADNNSETDDNFVPTPNVPETPANPAVKQGRNNNKPTETKFLPKRSVAQSEPANKTTARKLPQTGEVKDELSLVGILGLLVGLMGLAFGIKRKKPRG